MRSVVEALDGHDRIPSWTMGDRLRKARESAGLEQVELARVTGMSRQTVSNYERNAVAPRRAGLRLWAMATGVPLIWLEAGVTPDFGVLGEPTSTVGNRVRPTSTSAVAA